MVRTSRRTTGRRVMEATLYMGARRGGAAWSAADAPDAGREELGAQVEQHDDRDGHHEPGQPEVQRERIAQYARPALGMGLVLSPMQVEHERPQALPAVGVHALEVDAERALPCGPHHRRGHVDRARVVRQLQLHTHRGVGHERGLGLHGTAIHGEVDGLALHASPSVVDRRRDTDGDPIELANIGYARVADTPLRRAKAPATELAAERVDVEEAEKALARARTTGPPGLAPTAPWAGWRRHGNSALLPW